MRFALLISLEGAGHGGAQFETKENIKQVITFLDKYLKQCLIDASCYLSFRRA
jgi:hypothetical protein